MLFVLPAVVRAQDCTPPARPAFEFQVDMPASAIADSTHPHPAGDHLAGRRDDPEAILVQFVVDTAGIPIVQTFHALKFPSLAVVDSVRAVLPQWRYTPARIGACRVPQLVQTTVVR